MDWAQVINHTMSVKRPDFVSFKPSPNPTAKNPWHSQPEMMRSTKPNNSTCFFRINYMLEGKKVKLAFQALVVNYRGNLDVSSIILNATTCLAIGSMSTWKYLWTTIPNYSKASRPVQIPPKNSNNVIPSLGSVQVISWRTTGLIGSPWLSMFLKLNRILTKGSWVALNLCSWFLLLDLHQRYIEGLK